MAQLRALTRILKNLHKLDQEEAKNENDLTVKLAQLNEEYRHYNEISVLLPDTDETNKIKDEIEELYFTMKMNFRRSSLAYAKPESSTTLDALIESQKNFIEELKFLKKPQENEFPLPLVQIPSFSGVYDEFPSFKDLFESTINGNNQLADVHKLQYLKSLLKGEAAELIKHIPITEGNYAEAWELIQTRYDHKKRVISKLVMKFLDQPAFSTPLPKNLHHMANLSTEVLSGLKVLGSAAETRDPWLISILLNKMDSETKEIWASDTIDDHFPTINSFIQFLRKRALIKESHESEKKISNSKVRSIQGMYASRNKFECINCEEEHGLYNCPKYLELSFENRKILLKNKKVCFNCLKPGHFAAECRSRFTCRKCKLRHHTTIHEENVTNHNETTAEEPTSATVSSLALNSSCVLKCKSILPTAIVLIKDFSGKLQKCRVMLDSGAEASFVSEACAQRLKLSRKNARIPITGLTSGTIITRGIVNLKIFSSHSAQPCLSLDALILNNLNCTTPTSEISVKDEEFLQFIELADSEYRTPAGVDIIIGAEKFFEVMLDGKIRNSNGELIAQNSMFGWIVVKGLNSNQSHIPSFHVNSTMIKDATYDNLDQILKKFWEVEENEFTHIESIKNQECEKMFIETTIKKNNRFQVRLPFANQFNKLGTSKHIALKRFLSLERNLYKSETLRKEYSDVIKEYQLLGHMVSVEKTEQAESGYFLPHRAVFKDSTTTKIRIVFDGSSKTSTGVSLNDILLVGPTIQPTLWSTLIRFRQHKYVLHSDVEKMYRQVNLHPEDQQYQKLLWRDDKTSEIKTFHLTTVTFGLSCSAYLAIRCLQQCALDLKEKYPRTAEIVRRDFYVDDLLTGADSVEDLQTIQNELNIILESGGFKLRKWRSNFKGISNSSENITCFEDSTQKILGIQWNSKLDEFTFKIKAIEEKVTTKRTIISNSAKIYDPMGWLSPFTVLTKILYQKLWLIKIDWDEPVPTSIAYVWDRIKNQMIELEQIKIPRYIPFHNIDLQLHGFCDSSERAYGAVIYARYMDEESKTIKVQLITSKTKVAPIKQISLPRLELCGAVLLAKLLNNVTKNLNHTNEVFAWTDSMIVIHWLSDHPSRWKSFIANRTSEILSLYPINHWNHTRSFDNPADYASRGLLPAELKNLKKWWSGPEWLCKEKTMWPVQPKDFEVKTNEERKNPLKILQHQLENNEIIDNLLERFNSFSKILRILSYVRRFLHRLKGKENNFKTLTSEELIQSRNLLVKYIQQTHFYLELKDIRNHNCVNISSKLKSLDPFLDEEGILRVGGRIRNSSLSYSKRFPIILPKSHPITKIIVLYFHEKNLHSGASLTCHLIRQEYWIIQGRSIIRNIVRNCITCFKQKPNLLKQQMGNLPSVRVTPSKPFEKTGIDFAGPIYISSKKGRGAKHLKAYVSVYVCMVTKAIHLELVSDLSTDNFLASFKRFISRRGLPSHVYSDNGTNFVGADRKLREIYKILKNKNDDPKATQFYSENNIQWHFLPASAPNFGGIWEAAVKAMKSHLLKCTHNCFLTFEEMSTLLAQIEAVLNSRPISIISEDDVSYEALTPGHFLIGAPLTSIPEPLQEEKMSYRTRWQQVQLRAQAFWKRFSIEYFNQLQQRHKWISKQPNLNLNDLVLIKDEKMPSCKWALGRIISLHPGDDGLVRVATVKTSNSILKRPVNKLAKLPNI